MAKKISGVQSAVIAVHRHNKLPPGWRKELNDKGIGMSELLVLMSMQVMLCPETITDEEWKLIEENGDV